MPGPPLSYAYGRTVLNDVSWLSVALIREALLSRAGRHWRRRLHDSSILQGGPSRRPIRQKILLNATSLGPVDGFDQDEASGEGDERVYFSALAARAAPAG